MKINKLGIILGMLCSLEIINSSLSPRGRGSDSNVRPARMLDNVLRLLNKEGGIDFKAWYDLMDSPVRKTGFRKLLIEEYKLGKAEKLIEFLMDPRNHIWDNLEELHWFLAKAFSFDKDWPLREKWEALAGYNEPDESTGRINWVDHLSAIIESGNTEFYDALERGQIEGGFNIREIDSKVILGLEVSPDANVYLRWRGRDDRRSNASLDRVSPYASKTFERVSSDWVEYDHNGFIHFPFESSFGVPHWWGMIDPTPVIEDDVISHIQKGNFKAVQSAIYNSKAEYYNEQRLFESAFEAPNSDMLRLIANRYPSGLDALKATMMAGNINRSAELLFMRRNDPIDLGFITEVANSVAGLGHLQMLKWIYQRFNILPECIKHYEGTGEMGYLAVVKWLKEVKPEIFTNKSSTDRRVAHENIDQRERPRSETGESKSDDSESMEQVD